MLLAEDGHQILLSLSGDVTRKFELLTLPEKKLHCFQHDIYIYYSMHAIYLWNHRVA